MVYRYMYAAYADEAETFADIGGDRVMTVTLSRFRDMLFLYYETHEKDLAPEQVISGKTRPFPDGRHWFFMPDIFHYSRPLSDEHWERRIAGKRPSPRLNRLRREKMGSYIFYHHQLQEEHPGMCDKYGMIGLFDNYIFFYLELPEEPETTQYAGELSTDNTPMDKWNELMTSHFMPWEDVPVEWREIDVVLHR